MKKIYLLLAICLLNPGFIFSQYPAQNFTLLSVINPETGLNPNGMKYSACWGWTQPVTNKEYAIACSKSGTYWVDVTNPLSPTVCAFAAGTSSNGTWREVKTYQNYCYVVCDDNVSTGFQIFDMSTLPGTVTLVSSNMNLFKRGHACFVDGNKLYVSGVTYSNATTSSMDVYSLATPSAPVLLRQLKQDYNFISYVHDEFVRNDTIYASCGNQGLFVFKFNPNNTFSQIGSLTSYTAQGYNHMSALTPNGQTLVFMDEVPAGLPIKVANVSNLANIQVLATCNQYTQTTPHNPFMVSNQYCFASAYRDGTQLWDISNPSSPFLAGYFDTHPQTGGSNNNWTGSAYEGQWGMYPYFPSRNIFALDEQNGIFMFNTHLYNFSEINITGNAFNIPDGSVTTSTVNNTDFGTQVVGNNTSNAFVLQNTGVGILNVSSYSVTGANASDFSVSGVSPSFSVAGSSSVSFTIQFTPSTTGTRSATITFYNNDTNEGVYDFVVTGTGITTSGLKTSSLSNDFAIFPNPASDVVSVICSDENACSSVKVRIFDTQGRMVKEQDLSVERKIDVRGLATGIFYLQISSGNETITGKKFIVTR